MSAMIPLNFVVEVLSIANGVATIKLRFEDKEGKEFASSLDLKSPRILMAHDVLHVGPIFMDPESRMQ